MKNLVLILVSALISQSAFALAFNDPNSMNAIGVLGFQNAAVKSAELFDAEGAYVVQMNFELTGCMDKLAPLSYVAIPSDNELMIVITALQAQTIDSQSVRCAAPVVQNAAVVIPASSEWKQRYQGRVKLVFTSTGQEFNIMSADF